MSNPVKVGIVTDIPEGTMKMVTVENQQVCLARVGGKFYAIRNSCTHMRCPLAKGKLDHYTVTCPCHGSQFDVRTGAVLRPPATEPEPTFEVKVEGTDLLLLSKNTASRNLPLG